METFWSKATIAAINEERIACIFLREASKKMISLRAGETRLERGFGEFLDLGLGVTFKWNPQVM